ncbi:hypothetical protein [Nocardia asiatica]|uniref:hypothetical protein n=1 Tax=Nocardia asiatica TaxID=209252 RepID=UPI0002DF6669|nr:hypothetical protein [Nocardia asiatica]
MTVRRYYVDVHCCGPRWLIHVPALDRWTVTGDKSAIRSTARRMIAATTGHDDHSFELDLAAGRALRDAEEFTVGHRVPTRWHPPDEPAERAPPCTTSRVPNPGGSPLSRTVRAPPLREARPIRSGSSAVTPNRDRRRHRRCR